METRNGGSASERQDAGANIPAILSRRRGAWGCPNALQLKLGAREIRAQGRSRQFRPGTGRPARPSGSGTPRAASGRHHFWRRIRFDAKELTAFKIAAMAD